MMNEEQEIRSAEAERWWQYYRDAMAYSKEYGASTIQSLILINGGAILALLSFLATSEIKKVMADATQICYLYETFAAFAIGLIFAVMAGASGHFSYFFITEKQPGPWGLKEYTSTGDVSGWKTHKGLRIAGGVGIVFSTLSLVAFLVGCWFALQAIIGVI